MHDIHCGNIDVLSFPFVFKNSVECHIILFILFGLFWKIRFQD